MPRSAVRLRPLLAAAAALCLAPAGARAAAAAPDPRAAAVVARYLQVTGGAAAFAAESTVYTRASLTGFGFSGAFESWLARPDRRFERTTLGPFKLSEGAAGGSAWRTDPTTGRVVALADHDLADARAGTWFDLERWAEPDQGGGTVAFAGGGSDSTGHYTVLEVAPPADMSAGGSVRPRRLWFDDATGLLARIVAYNDQREVVTRLSDWRTGGGRRRPWVSETSVTGMPANRLRTLTDSLAVNAPVTGVAFGAPAGGGGNALTWLHAAGSATLPFEYRARHVWLKAAVDGGPPQDFLFDTGASVSVVDSGWAVAHGLKTAGYMQAAGAGAAGGASFATLGSLRIAGPDGDGVELRDLKVGVLALNPQFAPLFWRPLAGIVGYDVISRFVVTLDYDARTLTLHDPATWTYTGRETPLPMVMNGTVPAVRGTLDGRDEGLFRLDVGSSSTVDVHTPFARAHALGRRLRHPIAISGVGFGGGFASRVGRLTRMSLGPYAWEDPVVSLPEASEGAFASEDFAGNVGNRVLERFRVTLDYAHRQVILEPGRRFASRDGFTRAGTLLEWHADSVTAASVLPGSPAARAGLRDGDTVVAIDGRAATAWDFNALTTLFEDGPDGRVVPLQVRRDGRERTLRLRLEEMLP